MNTDDHASQIADKILAIADENRTDGFIDGPYVEWLLHNIKLKTWSKVRYANSALAEELGIRTR